MVWEPDWLVGLDYRDLLEMSRFHFAVVRSVGRSNENLSLHPSHANKHFYSIIDLTQTHFSILSFRPGDKTVSPLPEDSQYSSVYITERSTNCSHHISHRNIDTSSRPTDTNPRIQRRVGTRRLIQESVCTSNSIFAINPVFRIQHLPRRPYQVYHTMMKIKRRVAWRSEDITTRVTAH